MREGRGGGEDASLLEQIMVWRCWQGGGGRSEDWEGADIG